KDSLSRAGQKNSRRNRRSRPQAEALIVVEEEELVFAVEDPRDPDRTREGITELIADQLRLVHVPQVVEEAVGAGGAVASELEGRTVITIGPRWGDELYG